MKKRKELDALVSNGKISSSKRINCNKKGSGSCSAHELLRHDTDTSDMEDFSILQPRRKGRKKHGNRLCLTSVCLSLCQFILVTTSCLVSGALIWLHIGLREDIDLLRAHLQKVEAGNRNTPEALHLIHSTLRQLDSNVTMLYIEVRKNIADIENITCEVKQLKEVSNNLKESIAAAPAIQQLPKDVHSLSESVASFGSKMNALESNIKELKDQQSALQTTAQNLSGELDTIKIIVQELNNSTDFQTKSVNTSVKDLKLHNAVQETNQYVHYLQGQLMNVVQSVNKINTTFSNHLSAYRDLPTKVETVNDAIVWIINDTHTQNSQILALENFIYTNLTVRLEQLESEKGNSLKKSGVPDLEDYLNKTVSDVIIHLINEGVFRSDIQNTNDDPLHSLEQTHDVLVLLAALLKKFEEIPKTYILTYKNGTELVKSMLRQAFDEMMTNRDLKIKAMEGEIKNLSIYIPGGQNKEANKHEDEDDSSNFTTPLFVESSSYSRNND
ncbi:EF-hand domain-containing protein, partial [Stegodyphus mimosarum]